MRLGKYIYSIAGMVVLSLGICTANASTVVYEDSALVFGDTVSSNEFDITQAGVYEATLADFGYTSFFDILSLTITQDNVVLGFGFDTGKFTFSAMTPGKLIAHLVANPQPGNQGLYALQIKAIPVPPAALLFISGLVGLVMVSRRRGDGVTMA